MWSPLAGSKRLLGLLVDTFVRSGPLVLGLDDTIERRGGDQIDAKGIYRGPVRSSHGHFVKASGLRWLSLMLLAPLPWADRLWALPFMSVLCPSQRYYEKYPRRPLTLLERGQTMLHLLARWLPGRRLIVVADHSFSALTFLAAVRPYVALITRLRLDAALYEPAPPPRQGQPGRPRKKAPGWPTLQHHLDDPTTPWMAKILFAAFLVVMSIVLMNLVVGLAISDIAALRYVDSLP